MIQKTKTVYYCEFCGQHRFMRNAIEKHERHCTLNPNRACRWTDYDGQHLEIDLPALVTELQLRAEEYYEDPMWTYARKGLKTSDIEWLRQVTDCPACMLAVFRQSGIDYHYTVDHVRWDYMEEVERWRAEQRKAEDYAEMRAIEGTWI